MKKIACILLLFPFISFSQSAIIKNLCPTEKHHHLIDTIKSVSYPIIYNANGSLFTSINTIIRANLLPSGEFDATKPIDKVLRGIYRKNKKLLLSGKFNMFQYTVYRNNNGFLSMTLTETTLKGTTKPPIYLNFDLNTGKLISLNELLNTKNDSISMRQAILPPITDSIRLLELTIDKNNPNYSKIIEGLNSGLGGFIHDYPSHFIIAKKELIVYYDCILPDDIMHYHHQYKVSFRLKLLKKILKPEIINKLL
jgi:hypothetical protein